MMPTFSTPNKLGIALQDAYPNLNDTTIPYRDFILFRDKQFSLWKVASPEGKDVPIELSSKFTQMQFAKQAIDDFLDGTVKRRSENRTIIQIPLVNSDKQVSIYEEDFKELMRLGVSDRWSLVQGQPMVRVANRNNPANVARLMLDAKAKQAVRFIDKDKCNLVRDNLSIEKGPGKYDARAVLLEQGQTSALAGNGDIERS